MRTLPMTFLLTPSMAHGPKAGSISRSRSGRVRRLLRRRRVVRGL